MAELLLDSLEIKGYRCFEHLTIEKLGRVNLIVGKNNVGKTALLEALWIFLTNGNSFLKILVYRDENLMPNSFINTDKMLQENLLNRNSKAQEIEINTIKRDKVFFCVWQDQKLRTQTSRMLSVKHFFIRKDGLTNEEIINFWDKIELTPSEDSITNSMRLILPNLLRVRLKNVQNDNRIPYAQISDFDEPFTLKSFGDGLNRLFGLTLALANCKDGILLVDEIENGFHYSVLPDVWKLIFKTAKDLNVQVFATTHSKDCIESFTQAAVEDEESEGMLIRLERNKEDKIVAKTIEEERLNLAIKHEVEVR